MDFETLGIIAASWIVLSIVISPALGFFLRESNAGAVNEGKLPQTD